MVTAITTLIIGLLSIATNIFITFYNAGRNRKIYEIKPLFTGEGHTEKEINEVLDRGDYTILYVGQDLSNTRRFKYILGRVK